MNSALRAAAYYKLLPKDGSESSLSERLAKDVMEFVLASLQEQYPEHEIQDAPGLSRFNGNGVFVRLANASDRGAFALEVVDLNSREHWDVFVLRLPDGSYRTGWSRLGERAGSEPHAWLEGVAHFSLGEPVHPLAPPDFSALAVAMFSDAGVTLSSWDEPDRAALANEVDVLRQQLSERTRQLRSLKQHLSTVDRSSEPTTTVAYERLDQIDDWALENSDRIYILPRALSECRKSVYADAALLYQALDLLAVTYRDVRLNLAPRESLGDRARELGLDIGGSVDPSRSTEDYFFRWKGRRTFLDQHLGRGNSRDLRHCLRIYYTWDDEDEMVIVGSMPTHLGNSMS